ncbi:MAG: MerR family transcriptional regulator [Deltaproteobacteria bacterium]|nr:MAG: MerR family transcriptional regulator [Deltaproteobacteria bacterium]
MGPKPRQKKLFRIGEVSHLTGVEPHVLRYWESEFNLIRPNRQLSKQRWYRQSDIDLILEIKRLLQEEKYTLPGVKQYLAQSRPQTSTASTSDNHPDSKTAGPEFQETDLISLIRAELKALQEILR